MKSSVVSNKGVSVCKDNVQLMFFRLRKANHPSNKNCCTKVLYQAPGPHVGAHSCEWCFCVLRSPHTWIHSPSLRYVYALLLWLDGVYRHFMYIQCLCMHIWYLAINLRFVDWKVYAYTSSIQYVVIRYQLAICVEDNHLSLCLYNQ